MSGQNKNTVRQCNAADFVEARTVPATVPQEQLVKEQNLLEVFTTLNDSVKIRVQFLECIQNLLVRHRGKGRYPDRASILTALTMMQNNRDLLKILQRGGNSLKQSWFQGFQDFTQVLVSASVGSINPTHLEIINNVKKACERLYADRRLNPVFKTMISQLQFPLIKLAFLDKIFLQKDNHPATQVFNRLIQTGLRLSSLKDFRSHAAYFESIHVVTRIIDEYVDDNAVFEDIIQNSSLFTDPVVVVNPESAVTPEVPQAAIPAAPVVNESSVDPVTQVVMDLIEGHDLPKDVELFLTGTWRMIMTKSRRQYGEQHTLWRMAVNVIERIVWCYEPKRNVEEKDALRRMFPRLLLDIEDGLRTIMHNRREKENLIGVLMQKYTMHLTEIYRCK